MLELVCFGSAKSLDAVMGTALVLRGAHLCWSHFGSAVCANSVNSGSSSKIKPTLMVSKELNDRFATLEHSLASLAEHVDKLAKRLDSPGPMVSQLSSGCQPLVTPSSQNQGADIIMSESLGIATSDKIIVEVAVFDASVVSKIEDTLKNFSITVMDLLAKIDNANLVLLALSSQ
ncbi:hypothetical protein G9A89_015555 [Geosiphon pyriformis]|nr:hypothetical protein G9A89_015555 [Geosiphon pyriformis]